MDNRNRRPPQGDEILRQAVENVLARKIRESGTKNIFKAVPGLVKGDSPRWVHTLHLDGRGRVRIENATTEDFSLPQLIRICEIFGATDDEVMAEHDSLSAKTDEP